MYACLLRFLKNTSFAPQSYPLTQVTFSSSTFFDLQSSWRNLFHSCHIYWLMLLLNTAWGKFRFYYALLLCCVSDLFIRNLHIFNAILTNSAFKIQTSLNMFIIVNIFQYREPEISYLLTCYWWLLF